jgi:hypothetical protein
MIQTRSLTNRRGILEALLVEHGVVGRCRRSSSAMKRWLTASPSSITSQ